jgi:exopolysaccharide production protein ExoQ
MPSQIATLIFVFGIVGLFVLDRDKGTRTSKALWIPVAWLFINSSRPVSMWMGMFGLGGASPGTDRAQIYLEGSPVDGGVFMFLLVAGLIVLAGRSQRVIPLFRRMGPILLFFTYCALSILWSAYPFVTFKHWSKGIGDVVMILVVLTDPDPTAALKRLFSRVGFVLLPLSILFIKYYPSLGRSYSVGGMPQYTGVTTQKNTLGVMCLIFGLGSLWRFLAVYRDREVARRTHLLIAHGAILAMVVWLLRTSDSMTSFSCLIMASGIMVLTSRPTIARKPSVVHLLVAATVCFSLFAVFFDSGGSVVESLGRNSTLTGRTAIWTAVLRLAGNPVVGTGYESFWLGDRLKELWSVDDGAFIGINEAHNGYLELFLNLGWLGVALLAGLIATGYRKVIATYRYNPDAGSLGLACFAAELSYNLTEAGFRMMFPLWIFFLLAIIGVPKDPAPQSLSAVGADLPDDFAVYESNVGHALGVGFRER